MPSLFVASMTVLPSGTSSVLPSISSSIMLLYVMRHETRLVLDVMHEFVAIVLDESAHRHRRRVTQRADRAALDVVGDVVQKVEIFELALAVLDTVDHAVEPAGALAARRALPAGFFIVEVRQIGRAHV